MHDSFQNLLLIRYPTPASGSIVMAFCGRLPDIKKCVSVFLISTCLTASLYPQDANLLSSSETREGIPFIQNYPPDQYRADGQNWAIAQDQRGILYFSNSDGILEYDGVNWQLIETENKTGVRSLAVDENNRIFIGAYGEIGYLAPDTTHQLQYISLLPWLDEKYHDFTDVWQTIVTSDGVYFGTQKYLFRWAGQKMKVWETNTIFLYTAQVNDHFYVREWKTGLWQMASDSMVLAPGGEKFIQNRTSAMLPYRNEDGKGGDKILVCTQTAGMYLYDGHSLEPFPTNFDDRLTQARIYQGARLANGHYALATMQDGVFIMDRKGNLLQHLNKASGLQNNTVWSLYLDQQGGLWLGMDSGISRVEINAPLTLFTDREGLEGVVVDIVRHQGVLYIATSRGVYYLEEAPGFSGQFKPVSGIPPQCWKLLSLGQSLLAGTYQGVYEIRNQQAHLVHRDYVFYLYPSQQDPNRIFLGLQGGLNALYYAGNQWTDEGRIEGIDQEIRDILETPEGKLWLTTRYQGLLQVDFSVGFTLQPEITHFDTLQGLPAGDRNVAFTTREGLRFATPRGIYRLDENQERFIADSALIEGFPNAQQPIYFATADRAGNFWLLLPEGSNSGFAFSRKDGTYTWDRTPLLRTDDTDLNIAYPDPAYENLTWFGGTERLVQYDASVPKNYALDFRTLIRQVIINGDSLVYGGTDLGSGPIPKLPYAENSVRFRSAAPSFDHESKNEYQYFLEGFDKNWSKWSPESQKDYTNLLEGKYRFHVRAKNIYQHTGAAAVYDFVILPPFYRSWWAYTLYALVLFGTLYAIRQREVKKIIAKHHQELELLEYEKLKELDQMKSRFFADISHEFRTPLTLILGPLENFISRSTKEEDIREYGLMNRNAQGLLRLINQLLDLSRLEAGKMTLEAQYENIIPLVKGIFYAFESLAQQKEIRLEFETSEEHAFLYYDRGKMEQILTNVLSNAFKFTPAGGVVRVKVNKLQKEEAGPFWEIEVSDSGIGIPEDQLPHIFERFYQSKNTYWKESQSSGIGLALVKEFVELHHGRITVTSEPNRGTRFSIILPAGKAHLQPEEITDQLAADHLPTGQTEPGLPAPDEAGWTPEPEAGVLPALVVEQKGNPDSFIVLLVEDNSDMRAFIRRQLADNYEIIEAVDGREGLEKAIETIPDLIISDVMMPRLDGLELCDTLKKDERTSHIPIILLTAKVDVESRLSGLERGADAYLAKPFNRTELLIRSRKLLELRERLRARYASLSPPPPAAEKDIQIEDAFLQKIRELVEQRLSDLNLDMGLLSDELGMSRSQVFRKVKALTGLPPSLFIRGIRLLRAKELLQTTEMNVSEVAYEVGFSTPAYFSDAFLEAFGVRPSEIRK